MTYACDILANNNTDFVIARNVKTGMAPVLIGGTFCSVSDMNFDFEKYYQKNNIFRTRYDMAISALKQSSSTEEKFNIIQNFLEKTMPLCEKQKLNERTGCVFDGEPFSYMVENKLCMCSERAVMAQYMCQQCNITSYFVNSFVNIKDGEKGLHAYLMFEENGQLCVYDPANPAKDKAPRIMKTNMDKVIFNDFIDAVNENADNPNNTAKNMVGFTCFHEDGKKFSYHSTCGTIKIGPQILKERRAAKLNAAPNREKSCEVYGG